MWLRRIERRVYSQNGEDGIVAYLTDRLKRNRRTLLEIGAGAGRENNSRALLEAGWSGVVVERKRSRAESYRLIAAQRRLRVKVLDINMTPTRAPEVVALLPRPNVDFFSLDIDGPDFHVMRALLDAGLRPKVLCLEYNAAFGDAAVTVPLGIGAPEGLEIVYFGCSLAAWRKLLEPRYRFVTVCRAGINAFFVDPDEIGELGRVRWLEFADCAEIAERQGDIAARRAKMAHLELEAV